MFFVLENYSSHRNFSQNNFGTKRSDYKKTMADVQFAEHAKNTVHLPRQNTGRILRGSGNPVSDVPRLC